MRNKMTRNPPEVVLNRVLDPQAKYDPRQFFWVGRLQPMVFVGIACDTGLVPDHREIVDGFADAFERLSVAVRQSADAV